ncbi:MAG: class I SAM-dependent methyltransferase [Bacteroidetes bacterium]|nr:class I SAM-dependent methyltransferase [Bacteroidota bacterium]
MGSFWSFLHLKEVNKIEIDSIERSLEHRKIIEKKTFLNSLYIEWYTKIKKISNYNEYGNFLELGSGAGFIKKIMPNVVTSDVINISGLDKIIFANNIPFENKSLDAIIMVDVFHHIPNVREFLNEADRVLKTDGVIVMSEPWNSIFGRFIYTFFHHEPFKVNSVWELANQGPLSSANGALPWIVFDRDKVIFEKNSPT